MDFILEPVKEEDIKQSLSPNGAIAYKAVVDGKMIGQLIWKELEKLYPKTKVWETCTPYFEKNIHFYINCLGFHAVEFFNPYHKDVHTSDDMIGGEYFFRFEKVME